MLLLAQAETSVGLTDFLPIAVTAAVVVVVLAGARRLIERSERFRAGREVGGQVLLLTLTLAGVIALVVALPIERELRGQILAFLGILLSAAIALASTSFLGNFLAGLQLRAVRSHRIGDFIRCNGHFGRITERGLFHAEIQTEDRDLTTLPNLFLATNPVTVVRSSGTIVSAAVSLGYDVPRKRVHDLMIEAAEAAGLEDPFHQVLELGDFSVTYRVAGLLGDVKELISVRSRLRAKLLDALHAGGVEIVSPTFMNTRALHAQREFIPESQGDQEEEPVSSTLEALAFDKAELAESIQSLKGELDGLPGEREDLEKRLKESSDEGVRRALEDELQRLEVRGKRLERVIEARESYLGNLDASD